MKEGSSRIIFGAMIAICPYCDRENTIPKQESYPAVILCDTDDDGCDKYFTLETYETITWTTKKIEGEE